MRPHVLFLLFASPPSLGGGFNFKPPMIHGVGDAPVRVAAGDVNGDIGHVVIWGGCAGFALDALFEFWRLRRR